ncbi:hypothetical protein [Streptomyces sp. NRRL S-350]|nr:hypothetical protein [Streptomyces sp. NRRL S-350]
MCTAKDGAGLHALTGGDHQAVRDLTRDLTRDLVPPWCAGS